jgi:hypothetical protein
MFKTVSIRVITPTAVLLAAVGCASAPKADPDIAGARALISQAEQSDAQRFASADLESSRSKLRQAEQYAHDKKPIPAMRLAQESSTDAEVALARTRAVKAQTALSDVNTGTRTLRNESLHESEQTQTAPAPAVIAVPQNSTPQNSTPVQR